MTSPTPVGNDSAIANRAIAFAVAQVGKPYVWGATGPNAYDCSGLMQAAYLAAGYPNMSRTTFTQISQGTPLDPRTPIGQRPPGALIFPDSTHVYMAIGGGQIVEAATTGIPVHVRNDYSPTAYAIRQLVGAGTGPGGGTVNAGLPGGNLVAAGVGALDITHWVDVLGNWAAYLALIAAGTLVALGGFYLVVGKTAPGAVGRVARKITPGQAPGAPAADRM